MTTDYAADVAKYVPNVNTAAVDVIVKYCGIALRGADSSLVSCTDAAEQERVRDGFATKKLGLAADAAEKGMVTVCEQMKAAHSKSRVTFNYLLATATGTMGKLA